MSGKGQPPGGVWTNRSAPVSAWRGVCWSPELHKYVAVSSGLVMTSSNGVSWNTSSCPTNDWRGVCWSASLGLFVSVANNTVNNVMTSPDGITWTSRTTPAIGSLIGVCWSPQLNLFVATRTGSGTAPSSNLKILTSPDGINWTSRATPTTDTGGYIAVAWSPTLGMFAAVNSSSSTPARIMTSPNGITWTNRVIATSSPTILPAASSSSIVWSDALSRFIVVAPQVLPGDMTSAYSTDGVNWNMTATGELRLRMLVATSNEVISIGQPGTLATEMIRITTNGITYTPGGTTPLVVWNATAYSPQLDQVVCVSNTSPYVMTSP